MASVFDLENTLLKIEVLASAAGYLHNDDGRHLQGELIEWIEIVAKEAAQQSREERKNG